MPNKTKTVQQVEIGDGLALGLLACGIDAIPGAKMAVELAFRRAWRRWSCASSYPQLQVGPSFDDIYVQIIRRHGRRRRITYADWANEPPYLVPSVAMESWTLEDALDALSETSGVPAVAWIELSTHFADCCNVHYGS